jgi:hypothetical protein
MRRLQAAERFGKSGCGHVGTSVPSLKVYRSPRRPERRSARAPAQGPRRRPGAIKHRGPGLLPPPPAALVQPGHAARASEALPAITPTRPLRCERDRTVRPTPGRGPWPGPGVACRASDDGGMRSSGLAVDPLPPPPPGGTPPPPPPPPPPSPPPPPPPPHPPLEAWGRGEAAQRLRRRTVKAEILLPGAAPELRHVGLVPCLEPPPRDLGGAEAVRRGLDEARTRRCQGRRSAGGVIGPARPPGERR